MQQSVENVQTNSVIKNFWGPAEILRYNNEHLRYNRSFETKNGS